MNEYKNAYSEIESFVRNHSEMNQGSYQGQYSLSKLEELVDRATPLEHDTQPFGLMGDIPTCSKCGLLWAMRVSMNYCNRCGQAIKWESEE